MYGYYHILYDTVTQYCCNKHWWSCTHICVISWVCDLICVVATHLWTQGSWGVRTYLYSWFTILTGCKASTLCELSQLWTLLLLLRILITTALVVSSVAMTFPLSVSPKVVVQERWVPRGRAALKPCDAAPAILWCASIRKPGVWSEPQSSMILIGQL